MLVDTGTARSYVFSDDKTEGWQPPSNHLAIGCHSFSPLRRSRGARAPESGAEVGVFGADGWISGGEVQVDLRHGVLSFGPETDAAPAATSLPLEVVQGIATTSLVVDGKPRRLMFDTGTADLLLLDPPRDGAALHQVHDALGSTIEYAKSTAVVTWPMGQTRTVPVWLTAHHPAFEKHRAELGVPLEGLLGLSAFEDATLVLRPGRGVIEVHFPE
jgi:hypothetical protein